MNGKMAPPPESHFLPWFILPLISLEPHPHPIPRTEPGTEQVQPGRQLAMCLALGSDGDPFLLAT